MVLALSATALVALALLSDLVVPRLEETWKRLRSHRGRAPDVMFDPGRERRAEQRARELLHSCVGEEEWDMYRDLGFIRVWGTMNDRGERRGADYAYLIYPHRPIVAYLTQTHRLLNEYCVEFPDVTRPYGSSRLPDSDDVLAKWMALTGDERRLIETANMHLPGRALDPVAVGRDLWRLSRWERARIRGQESRLTGPPPAPRADAAPPAAG